MPRHFLLRVLLLAGLVALQGPWQSLLANEEPIPILPREAEKEDVEDDFLSRRSEEISINPLSEELVSVRLVSRGDSREAAMNQARVDAVKASAGRVLITGRLIRASGLMLRYLENYAEDFITGVEVLSESFSGGENVLDSRVYVDFNRLISDLEEKRFLYRPEYKPMFNIYMDEDLEGQEIDQEIARVILQSELANNDIKNYLGVVSSPPSSVNVKAEDLLEEAFVASERRNVEVMMTGNTTTRQIEGLETRQVYYDTFYFYETNMDVTIYRVDNREELFSLSAKGSAAGRDRADAIRQSIERAAERIAEQTAANYREKWQDVVRGDSDYEILLTGADEELINVVQLHLDRLGQNSKIYLKRHFDRSAVLSIVTDASKSELLEVIGACPFPTLTVVREVSDRRFEVRISS